MVGCGEIEIKAHSAQLELELGLSLAITLLPLRPASNTKGQHAYSAETKISSEEGELR